MGASAAEILREADQLEAAVDCAIEGDCWDKARELAHGHPKLEEVVEKNFQSHLVSRNNTQGLIELGHTNAALDVLAKSEEWDKLWDMAAKERIGAGEMAR